MAGQNLYETFRPQLDEMIARVIDGARLVLEVGCGRCALCCFLSRRVGCHVVGLDVSGDAIHDGRKTVEHERISRSVECLHRDGSTLDFIAPRSIDTAVSVYALHEMANPLLVLRQVRRALKPDGKLVVADFPRGSEASRLWRENYFTRSAMRSLIRRAGYQDIDCSLVAHGQLVFIVAFPSPHSKEKEK